jgi:hypothetical protein
MVAILFLIALQRLEEGQEGPVVDIQAISDIRVVRVGAVLVMMVILELMVLVVFGPLVKGTRVGVDISHMEMVAEVALAKLDFQAQLPAREEMAELERLHQYQVHQ